MNTSFSMDAPVVKARVLSVLDKGSDITVGLGMKCALWVVSTATTAMTTWCGWSASALASSGQAVTAVLKQAVDVSGSKMVEGPDGSLYVLKEGGDVQKVTSSDTVLNSLSLSAQDIALAPDGSVLYVLQGSASSYGIAVVNTSNGSVEKQLGDGNFAQPVAIAVSHDGKTLYVLDVGGGAARLFAIDASSGKEAWSTTFNSLDNINGSSYQILVDPNDSMVYVPTGSQGVLSDFNPGFVTVDPVTKTAVSLDVADTSSMDPGVVDKAVFSSDGLDIYVADGQNGILKVAVSSGDVSTLGGSQSSRVNLGATFVMMNGATLYATDGTRVYAVNSSDGSRLFTIDNPRFQTVNGLAFVPSKNELDVLTDTALFVYSVKTTSAGSEGGSPGPAGDKNSSQYNLTLSAGWNLVDTRVSIAGVNTVRYHWNGLNYVNNATTPLDAEWLYVPSLTDAKVTFASIKPSSDYSLTLLAKRWGMVGDPFDVPMSISVHAGDVGYTYDTSTQQYVKFSDSKGKFVLPPGQGGWFYSAAGGNYVITPAS